MEYNVQQEARVWNRVMGMERQSQNPNHNQNQNQNQGCGCPLSPEMIMELIREELAAACLYRHLACRVCCRCREILRKHAEDEMCHARQLSAIYFVLTGKKACPDRVNPPCITCAAESLRQQYQQELEDQKRYEALAQRSGEFSHTFHCLAKDEARHARNLLCVMGETV